MACYKLNNDMSKICSSNYMLRDFNIWHERLCHVNKLIISNMSGLGLIPKVSLKEFEKC